MAGLPKTYDEWKYCITVKCGIALTQDYVNERLSVLSKVSDYSTAKFIEMWGPEHHQKTIEYFSQAANEFKAK